MNGAIQRFEDFVAWQKARTMTSAIYSVTREGTFARDFPLRDQIRSAAISVMSNIAEGFERGKPTEFHHFLCIAKASCAEVRSQLYIALDAKHIEPATFAELMALAAEVGRLLGGLRQSVERRRDSS